MNRLEFLTTKAAVLVQTAELQTKMGGRDLTVARGAFNLIAEAAHALEEAAGIAPEPYRAEFRAKFIGLVQILGELTDAIKDLEGEEMAAAREATKH
ncbi:hypothetical protein [Caballeronia grimmiae]|uniref:hypothetical protein n=1 Tax=Caballeronia grimmiae TaxID=1071679 RepID=UPI0038B9505E